MTNDVEEVKHFTSAKPRIPFTIDGDNLEAYGQLSANSFAEFATKLQVMGLEGKRLKELAEQAKEAGREPDEVVDINKQMTDVLDVVEICMVPSSVDIVAARLSDDDNPVSFETLMDLLNWLLEKYELADKSKGDKDKNAKPGEGPVAGERPTPPTSESPTGSQSTGVGGAEA